MSLLPDAPHRPRLSAHDGSHWGASVLFDGRRLQCAHLHANLHQLTTITADVVDYAYEQAMRHLQSIYDVQWQELHRFLHADTVFAALVEGAAPYSLSISGSVVTKAIQNLIRLSIIVKGEGRGEYHLVEPMFGGWFLHQQGR